MKKVYQAPDMLTVEMIALSMVAATTPRVGINTTGSVAAEDVGVKNEAWDDWDE